MSWRNPKRRIVWGSYKFHNAFGHSIRISPSPLQIWRDARGKMQIKPGGLTIEMTRSSVEPMKISVKPEMFAQFLMKEKSVFIIGNHDRRLYIRQFKKNKNDFDRWKMFDTVSNEHVTCGFIDTVLTQVQALVISLFHWSYGFNLLVPRKIDEKSSEIFVKHELICGKSKRLEIKFTPPIVETDGLLSHGGIFLSFKERTTLLELQLSINDAFRLFGHDFEESMQFENEGDIILQSSYDSKSDNHFLTAKREKLQISFSLTSSEFQQFRWMLITAIPVVTGFESAFEDSVISSREMLRQDRVTSFLDFRSRKLQEQNDEF